MVWKIFQQLATANEINNSLALAKCNIQGSKLYIRTAPSEGRCTKREPRREPKGQTCSRSPSSDPDNRQSCSVKANSCRNRCPTPTHKGATKTKMSSTTQDMSHIVKQKNHTQQGIYTFDQLRYTNILTQAPLILGINNLIRYRLSHQLHTPARG